MDVKTVAFEETDDMEEMNTSLYDYHTKPSTDDIDTLFTQEKSASTKKNQKKTKNSMPYLSISNHTSNLSKDSSSSSTTTPSLSSLSTGYSRGIKSSISNTSIEQIGSQYSLGQQNYFSRSSSSVPSLIYSLNKISPIDSLPDRDWNKEFNEVLESPLLERAEKLRELETEFVKVAKIIGKIIISERNVHPSQKTIKPISSEGSGFAGGEKYAVKGIFFKFAVDKSSLYGSDENAMKVACHELKGHTALVSCGMVHGLKLGLMTIIDYLGSRVTAASVLPISNDTLVYGSSDGGQIVCSSFQAMNDVMRQCGKVLNLKGHLAGVGENKKFIYGPCDLEGHLGHDGRLYAIDLARLFPPETPKKSITGASYLFRLLRPELVRKFPKPLSSDAFTMFGIHDSEKHDAEVRQASEYLHNVVIPEFANCLSNDHDNHNISIDDIIIKLHRAGINIRYLGEVRSYTTNVSLRKNLLTEICARVFKNEFRKKLREQSSQFSPAFSSLAINFFNNIFGDKKISFVFWQIIKKPIEQRFVNTLSVNELQKNLDIRKHVHMDRLFYRLQYLLGISLNCSFDSLPLSPYQILDFVVKAKQMYTVPRIEADTAAELARTTKNVDEAKRLLILARENYHSVLELKPDDHIVLSSMFLFFFIFF